MNCLSRFLPLFLFAALAAALAVPLLQGRDPQILPSALIGRVAPAFTLPALAAGTLTQDDIVALAAADGAVAVNFFSSWCLPCKAEHPVLAGLAQAGVPLVGVAYKDSAENIRRWLDEHGNVYAHVALDEAGAAAIDWGVYGVPETFVVDRSGIIRYRYVGPLTAAEVAGTLQPLLQSLRGEGKP